MDLLRLRWLTVVVPLVFLAAIDVARHLFLPQLLHPWPGYLIVLIVVSGGIFLFSRAVFDYIEAIEHRLVEQNRALENASETMRRQADQLRALHEADLLLSSDLNHAALLQRVVDLARALTSAHYGALGIVDDRGQIVRFLTSGLTDDEQAAIGTPPKGRGLLGAVLAEGRPVRVDDIASDPRSIGFPKGHPPMQTFLGVPIVIQGRAAGNLYLTDKRGPLGVTGFTAEDEDLLKLFAAQAAVAIENARLHAEIEALAAAAERGRIARELHDSLAQTLGYVRLRATSGRDALHDGDLTAASEVLEQISDAASEAYADVREAILGLRSQVAAERDLIGALEEYLERYRLQAGIGAVLDVGDRVRAARLALGAEAQLLRIIQEALTNVRKHAGATHVVVGLEIVSGPTGPFLRATVSDDGRGFAVDRSPDGTHFGLSTMRERAEMAGGSFRIESAPGQGTRVTVELPLELAPSLTTGTVSKVDSAAPTEEV